jgi:drug/metabolite transporter (DMT)-like permease
MVVGRKTFSPNFPALARLELLRKNGCMHRSAIYALFAAALFGASTPVAKLLGGTVEPVLLAGLLYLGSGLGLALFRLVRDRGWTPSGMQGGDWGWWLAAVAFGGVLGPVALVLGLQRISGSSASLFLNLESVLTALIAWMVFKENAGRRVVLGMAAIVAGGVLLTLPWSGPHAGKTDLGGAALVALACACWAIDNNLTRKVSASDAVFIAGGKGLVAGTVNTALALALGNALPGTGTLAAILATGLLGYGISLVLFVLALRDLGAARSGAYFSVAPFLGAAVALPLLGESVGWPFWLAALLMGLGVWLHLTERHAHRHTHEPLAHAHSHTHGDGNGSAEGDEHHRHAHLTGPPPVPGQPHSHWHQHAPITHKHPHYPDVHHQHVH